MRSGPLGQQFQCGPVGVGQFARDIQSKPRAARPRCEEWLEQARSRLGRYTGAVIIQLAYYCVAHVTVTRRDEDARRLFLAVLPCVAQQSPDDLAQVP